MAKPKRQRSIRFSEEHIEFINSQPGRDFSAKLAGLLDLFMMDETGIIQERMDLKCRQGLLVGMARRICILVESMRYVVKDFDEFDEELARHEIIAASMSSEVDEFVQEILEDDGKLSLDIPFS